MNFWKTSGAFLEIIPAYFKIKIMVRKKIPDDKKRKKISVAMNPEIYELWKIYCEENGIENYSEYIEKIIKEKIGNKK